MRQFSNWWQPIKDCSTATDINLPSPPKPEEHTMSLENQLLAMRDDFDTIEVIFGNENPSCNTNGKTYTYLTPKGMFVPEDLEVGEPKINNYSNYWDSGTFVLVCVGNIYKVAKLHAVHATPQLDYDRGKSYQWVVQRIDPSDYIKSSMLSDEAKEKLQMLKREQKRQEIMNTIKATYGEDALTILGLEAPIQGESDVSPTK